MAPQQAPIAQFGAEQVSAAEIEAYSLDLLARLGLPAGASNEEIERAHDQRVDFLAQAPGDLADWARSEIELVDQAYALLCDPHADIAAALAADRAGRAVAQSGELHGGAPKPATRPARQPMAKSTRTLLLVGLACALVFGVYQMGGDSGVPPITGTPTQSASAAPQLDQAGVAAAMQAISADPGDGVALKELGDLYFAAADYATAAKWYKKLRAAQPRDVAAMVALGASLFNSGDAPGAKKQWKAAVAIEPDNAEAHYDLGFLALSQSPEDFKTARAEWAEVVRIDPDSDLAKSVATHLDSLGQDGTK